LADRGFFKMETKYAVSLVIYLVVVVLIFMPWTTQIKVSGMVLQGWLMGFFMFFAPILSLLNLLTDRPESEKKTQSM